MPELFICNLLVTFTGGEGGLGGGQTSDGDAVGRTTDVIESDHVEELDAVGVATVLAADAQLQVRVGLTAVLSRHAHELADAVAVERLEGVDWQNLDPSLDTWLLQ